MHKSFWDSALGQHKVGCLYKGWKGCILGTEEQPYIGMQHAEKRAGAVVMTKEIYNEKVQNLISDETKYSEYCQNHGNSLNSESNDIAFNLRA